MISIYADLFIFRNLKVNVYAPAKLSFSWETSAILSGRKCSAQRNFRIIPFIVGPCHQVISKHKYADCLQLHFRDNFLWHLIREANIPQTDEGSIFNIKTA